MKYNFFSDSEFFSKLSTAEIKDVEQSNTLRNNKDELKAILNIIRRATNEPIMINSWYRNEEHNERAKGRPNSQHLDGEAVDITSKNNDKLYSTILQLMKKDLTLGQVIKYGSNPIRFIHISLCTRGKINHILNCE